MEKATGVAGGDDVCVESGDELGFAIAEFRGCFGLDEVVDSGGAAADRRFWNFEKLNAGDLGQECARLRTNALRVLKMARVVVRQEIH